MERALGRHKPKDSIELEIQRGSRKLKLSVQLQELPRRFDEPAQGIL